MEKKQKKQCTKCNKVFPITAFHRNCSRKDGRDNWCPKCKAQARKKRNAPKVKAKWLNGQISAGLELMFHGPIQLPGEKPKRNGGSGPPPRFPQLHDAKWLKREYIDNLKSPQEIADIIGCTATSVNAALRRAGIMQIPWGMRLGIRKRRERMVLSNLDVLTDGVLGGGDDGDG